MSHRFLYLFGEPGTGKITVARILQERLAPSEGSRGWKLFWLHDLDTVCQIVGRYPLPRLMDRISEAVLDELLDGQDVIYVRPSRDTETRERVRALAESKGYRTYSVRLWAPYETLVKRVEERVSGSKYRASSRADLDRYLTNRPGNITSIGECLVNTDRISAREVADQIMGLIPLIEQQGKESK